MNPSISGRARRSSKLQCDNAAYSYERNPPPLIKVTGQSSVHVGHAQSAQVRSNTDLLASTLLCESPPATAGLVSEAID